jgi:hypothetical protein
LPAFTILVMLESFSFGFLTVTSEHMFFSELLSRLLGDYLKQG